ncbi:Retinitis pigmentosa GTPase regulator [Balamuthia mandrillaris]
MTADVLLSASDDKLPVFAASTPSHSRTPHQSMYSSSSASTSSTTATSTSPRSSKHSSTSCSSTSTPSSATTASSSPTTPSSPFASLSFSKKTWLIPLFLAIFLGVYLSGLPSLLTFDNLKHHRQELRHWVSAHPRLSPLLYLSLYFLLVSLSLPGATVLTLTAGFLFAQPWATAYAVVGAASGACCLFLWARYGLGEGLFWRGGSANPRLFDGRGRRGEGEGEAGEEAGEGEEAEGREERGVMMERLAGWLKPPAEDENGEEGGEQGGEGSDQALYMLLLRLVPIFPFWLINLAPSLLGVRFSTFAWTTFVGIVPGSYLYTQCGYGLSKAMEQDLQQETLTSFLFKGMLNEDTALGFVILGLWASFLLGTLWWRRRERHRRQSHKNRSCVNGRGEEENKEKKEGKTIEERKRIEELKTKEKKCLVKQE